MKNIRVFFSSENFQFLEVKFYIYLNRGDFVIRTNARYETTDAQTKKICNRGTVLERSVGKLLESLKRIFDN